MACVGCGIAVDDDGQAIANVATWPHVCLIADNGTDVYCDPASGQLKGPPEKFQLRRKLEHVVDATTPSCRPVGQMVGAIPSGVVAVGGLSQVVVDNQSDCLEQQLWISAGVQHAIFTLMGEPCPGPNRRNQIFVGARVTVTGDVAIGPLDMGHQVLDLRVPCDETWSFDNAGTFFERPIAALPPGGSATFTLETMMQSLDLVPESCLFQVSTALFIHQYNA